MSVAWIDGRTGDIRTLDDRNLGWLTLSILRPLLPWKRQSPCCSASSPTPATFSTPARRATSRSRSTPTPRYLPWRSSSNYGATRAKAPSCAPSTVSLSTSALAVGGMHHSSLHRRVSELRRLLEPLRRTVVPESVGKPETLLVDSTSPIGIASAPAQAVGTVRGISVS